MFGWLSDPATRDSRRKRCAKDGSEAWNAASSLSATMRSRSVWRARWTVAMPPRPISRRISYRPTVRRTSGILAISAQAPPTLRRTRWMLLAGISFLTTQAGVVCRHRHGTATLLNGPQTVRETVNLFVLDPHTIYRRGLATSLEGLPEV